jgi:hypothetical protein
VKNKIVTPNEHVLCISPKGLRVEVRGQIATDLTGADTVKLVVTYGNQTYPEGTQVYVSTSLVASAPLVTIEGHSLRKILVQQVLASESGVECCEDEKCLHTRIVENVQPRRFE